MNLRISPFFFLTAMIIGYINSRTPIGTFLWTFVIFVSVLFHEFGHAFMGFIFGQKPRIELTAFGGLTYPDGPKLSLWKEFLVILAGPLFGFSLFVASYYLLMLPISNPYLIYILQALKLINFFWTLINLLPVLPLDGGQLVRVILQGFFGIKAWRYTYLVSTVLALILALGFFALGAYFVGAIFFLFAYQGFDAFKNARNMTEAD
ncbi:MAG: stage IV sporulation protein FB, partial [Chlamydiae bacterium]|nr:stage IV sporulation protein FB [Chlamydiota bacterium]